jgi:hypothetical protein
VSNKAKSDKPEEPAKPIEVDAIETAAEVIEKDHASAKKIIDRVMIIEGDIKLDLMAINLKKVYTGCLLLISRRLANSGAEEETGAGDKMKNSLFDEMINGKMLSRATAYRRIGDARVFIEAGVITSALLALIEKSEIATPELTSNLEKVLSTPKGIKIQQKQGLLPAPEKEKSKKVKSLKEKLDEKAKQLDAILVEIKQLLANRDLIKGIENSAAFEKLNRGYAQLDTSWLNFKTIEIPEPPKLDSLILPDITLPSTGQP